jgi:hypothetical protein
MAWPASRRSQPLCRSFTAGLFSGTPAETLNKPQQPFGILPDGTNTNP